MNRRMQLLLAAMAVVPSIELAGCRSATTAGRVPIASASVVLPTAGFGLRQPVGIAVDPNGGLIVADSGNHRLVRISESGTVAATYGEYGTRPGQFRRPLGATVDRDGRIYVADYLNNRIAVLDAEGRSLRQWTTFGNDDRFNGPADVTIDGQGNVYVVEFNASRVVRLDTHGKLLGVWGSQGHGDKHFYYPTRITIGPNGNVWVADAYNHRLKVYAPDGHLLSIIGEKGTGIGQFDVPGGVTFDTAGNVWAADFFNSRLQHFILSKDGRPSQTTIWTGYQTRLGHVHQPTDLAFDSRTSSLYVVDYGNNRLLRLTMSESMKHLGDKAFLSPRPGLTH